ncbi:odorant receptor Or2-like [Sabethes cyaneus]|uniref:odorant receptor Or2-like n=1 Tax=Sabethes cyaneus TaxID=53552 RepID=UPI00237E4299|nr:odorant receptor Or2-like [Sabethes cyaneus]
MLFTRNATRSLERPSLAVGLRTLRLIGLWGDRSRRWLRYALAVVSVLVMILPKAFLGSGRTEFDSFARNIAELVFLGENCLSIAIFAFRRKSFERLIDVLERIFQQEWPKPLRDEIQLFNRRLNLFARLYAFWITCMVNVFLIVPIASTALKLSGSNESERSNYTLVFEVQFYGLNIRQNLGHYIIYMIFCCLASYSSGIQSSIKGTVFLIILLYGSKLFELVEKRISDLKQIKAAAKRHRELREIIEVHNLALDYLRYLEETISFVLINQSVNCIIMWCLMLFYVSTNFGPEATNGIMLFFVLVVEMVVYCINGTMISEKAGRVAHAMYEHPWFDDRIELRRSARFIIQRAQKPAGLTAAKFYYVNIQRLGSMCQATYSYYLILKKRF